MAASSSSAKSSTSEDPSSVSARDLVLVRRVGLLDRERRLGLRLSPSPPSLAGTAFRRLDWRSRASRCRFASGDIGCVLTSDSSVSTSDASLEDFPDRIRFRLCGVLLDN